MLYCVSIPVSPYRNLTTEFNVELDNLSSYKKITRKQTRSLVYKVPCSVLPCYVEGTGNILFLYLNCEESHVLDFVT